MLRFFVAAGLLVGWAKPVAAETKPHVVLLSGEKLYDSAVTLPKYAEALEKKFGFRCTTLIRVEKNKFANLDALGQADLVIFYMRRMTLPADQLGQVK